MQRARLALLSAVFFSISSAHALDHAGLDRAAKLQLRTNLIDQETREFLDAFRENPIEARRKRPKKYSKDGNEVLTSRPYLQGADPQKSFGVKLSEEFQVANAKRRRNFCVGPLGSQTCLYEGELNSRQDLESSGRRGIAGNDRAEELVDNGRITRGEHRFRNNLFEMAEEGWTAGEVAVQPWSSDYWPIATGITAKRYADPNYPELSSGMAWHQIQPYIAQWYARHGANLDHFINSLSPAEKYDILVGDPNFTLTNQQISEGQTYAFDRNGNPRPVEMWMGICHGWAIAAYADARPRNTVVAHSPSGKQIEFRPDDIKALSVLKWANGQSVYNNGGSLQNASRFIGGRCNLTEDRVATDPTSGAIINDECFDSNPASFHAAMVNQLGVLKRSFVIDTTFDYEVWNQPMVNYSYTYFNPRTMRQVQTLRSAMEPYGFAGDRFVNVRGSKYHGRNTPAYVVGVIMEATYVVETAPSLAHSDSEARDGLRTVRYKYDVEVSAEGELMGGEWYSDGHPDFMWTSAPGAFAWNDADGYVRSAYSPHQAMPHDIAETARQASARGIVLKAIVDGLIQAAQ